MCIRDSNYSGRNALLMVSAGNDAITTVEAGGGGGGDSGWCNACRTDVKTPEAEVADKMTSSERARQPANALRNLVVVCLSCVLVVSGFRSAESLESSVNESARLGVISLCLMHAAAAGTCYVAPVMVARLGAKWTLVAGVAFYVVWLAANCAPHPCTLLPAAASVGLGESLLWTAQVPFARAQPMLRWTTVVIQNRKITQQKQVLVIPVLVYAFNAPITDHIAHSANYSTFGAGFSFYGWIRALVQCNVVW